MDKRIQLVRDFVTNEKNRTVVIATGVALAVVGMIATTKRGKAKRK